MPVRISKSTPMKTRTGIKYDLLRFKPFACASGAAVGGAFGGRETAEQAGVAIMWSSMPITMRKVIRPILISLVAAVPEAFTAAAKQDRKSCQGVPAPVRFSGKHGSSRCHRDGDGVEKSAGTGCVQCCMKSASEAGHGVSVVRTVGVLGPSRLEAWAEDPATPADDMHACALVGGIR